LFLNFSVLFSRTIPKKFQTENAVLFVAGVQLLRELDELRLAGISVFSVAVSNRADENLVLAISSVPQLINRNYFISPAIGNLVDLSTPLATQVIFLSTGYKITSIKPTTPACAK